MDFFIYRHRLDYYKQRIHYFSLTFSIALVSDSICKLQSINFSSHEYGLLLYDSKLFSIT